MLCVFWLRFVCNRSIFCSHSRRAEWDLLLVPRGTTSGLCSTRQLSMLTCFFPQNWAASALITFTPAPSPRMQRQKHVAQSLPPVSPTYYCSGNPVNTSISSITSYLLDGLTTCLKAMNGMWQCHLSVSDPTSVSLCRPFRTPLPAV